MIQDRIGSWPTNWEPYISTDHQTKVFNVAQFCDLFAFLSAFSFQWPTYKED